MAHYLLINDAARRLGNDPQTIRYWIGHGYIATYLDSKNRAHVDFDEIEAGFESNPKMRDPRRKFGPNAVVRPLPMKAVVVPDPAPAEPLSDAWLDAIAAEIDAEPGAER